MSDVNFYIKDSDMQKFFRDIDRYEKTKQEQIKVQIGDSALAIEGRAKTVHPWKVRTGRLRSSINASILNKGFTGRVVANTLYAKFLELGTKRMRKYPFMQPALKWETPRFIKKIKQILDKVG